MRIDYPLTVQSANQVQWKPVISLNNYKDEHAIFVLLLYSQLYTTEAKPVYTVFTQGLNFCINLRIISISNVLPVVASC